MTIMLIILDAAASAAPDLNDELSGLAECIRFLELQEPQGEEEVLPVNVIDGQEVNGTLAFQLATELQVWFTKMRLILMYFSLVDCIAR